VAALRRVDVPLPRTQKTDGIITAKNAERIPFLSAISAIFAVKLLRLRRPRASRRGGVTVSRLMVGIQRFIFREHFARTAAIRLYVKVRICDSDSGIADMGDNGGRWLRRQFEMALAWWRTQKQ
jgi:hypothetical protein